MDDVSNVQLFHGDTNDCKLRNTYTVQFCVLASLAVILGFVMCFFGYKLFKFVLFCTGFLIGFFIAYTLCALYISNLTGSLHENKEQVFLGIAAATGIIFGMVALCVFYVGLFILGATMGWFVGIAFLPVLHEHSSYLNAHNWMPLLILIGCAILCGILILCLQKVIIVIATSFIGAACMTNGFDYYVENSVTLYYSIKVLHGTVDSSMIPKCWYTWTVFSFLPILFVAGIAIQFGKTSRGQDHKRAYNGRPILISPPPDDETMMSEFPPDNHPLI